MTLQQFGPWLPDQPSLKAELAFDVLNVTPHEHGYHPWQDWNKAVDAPGTSGEIPLFFSYYISPSGVIYNFCGTTTKLWKLNSLGTTWDDASRVAGGAYNVPSEMAWSLTQYDNLVYASNGADVAQKFNLLGDTKFSDAAYPAAGPPVAKFLGVVRRFVVAAGLSTNSMGIAWSGLADPVNWTPDPVTLADDQILPTGGEITGFCGGEYGVVFQQHAIQKMVFSGPPLTFEFEKISTTLGLNATRSIAQYGDLIFFLSTSGVKLLRAAQELSDIGEGKVDTWLNENMDLTSLWKVTGTIDITNKLYLLGVPMNAAQPTCNLIIAYHWPTGEWSKIGYDHYLIGQMIPQTSYHLDNIDTIIGNNIDTMTYSLDSPSLISTSDMRIAAFSSARELGHFNGDLMPAMIMTGDIQLTEGKKTLVRSIRPIFEGMPIGLTVTPYVKDMMQEQAVPKGTAPINRNGKAPLRANGRYHRFQVNTAAGGSWEHAIGIDDIVGSEMAR